MEENKARDILEELDKTQSNYWQQLGLIVTLMIIFFIKTVMSSGGDASGKVISGVMIFAFACICVNFVSICIFGGKKEKIRCAFREGDYKKVLQDYEKIKEYDRRSKYTRIVLMVIMYVAYVFLIFHKSPEELFEYKVLEKAFIFL